MKVRTSHKKTTWADQLKTLAPSILWILEGVDIIGLIVNGRFGAPQ